MLDHFSIYKPLTTESNTGQYISPNHWGRTNDNLPFGQTGSNQPEGGFHLAADYYENSWDSEWSFKWEVMTPYVNQKRSADSGYNAQIDPDLPRPAQSQAESVVAKYEQLTGLTHQGLLNTDDLIVAGAMSELHPYWERMLIHTMLQEETSDGERQQLDDHYMQDGIGSVQSILENETYNAAPRVQFAYAQSTAFLKLSEADKAKFITMSLDNQWEIIYIDESERSTFIDAHDGVLTGSATSYLSSYSNDLLNAKNAMDLDAVLARFEQFQVDTGRDFKAEFEQVFQQQTQTMDFSSVADELKGVFQLYSGVLGRVPDQGGFEYWLKDLNGGNTLEEIAVGFVNSSEFQSQVGNEPGQPATIDQTLTALYNVVLGRDPDTEGFNWWKDQYENHGRTIGNVVTGFTWSEEFEANIDEELHAWLAVTYGPNLTQMDYAGLGFDAVEIAAIQPVGVYDINADDGYAGIML